MASGFGETNGKVALVTGGANGIGKGCLEILVENGWTVSCWDIDEAAGAAVQKKYPGRVFFRQCDVREEDQIKTSMTETFSQFGKLDCLVNNVGNQQPYITIDDCPIDDFRAALEWNLVSCFAMCKYALPHLRAVKGNIVNIASIVVEQGLPLAPTYCPAKAGVANLTKCLALDEAKHGVRVNAIAPGLIRTPLTEGLMESIGDVDAMFDKFSQMMLIRRPGHPREIGKACLYLASEATYSTGSVLRVTGGLEVGFGTKE